MNLVILLGAPGAGKGTIAEKMREATRYVHVSTGDMLREAIRKGTAVGKEADAYMKKGELVPDETIQKLMEERLDAGQPTDAYLLDGFPRTARQAELLEESVRRRSGARIARVILLDAKREVLIERLTGRRICRQCGRNYHVKNVPPKKDGVCDVCGGELYQRADDSEATIRNRLDVFKRQTEGLIARYESQGLLSRVDSGRAVDAVVKEIRDILGEKASRGGPAGGRGRAG